MTKRIKYVILILGFTTNIATFAHSGSSSKISSAKSLTANVVCKQIPGILKSVPGATIKQTDGVFEFEGVKFQGCSFKLEGKWSALKKDIHPTDIIYLEPDSKLYREGWLSDIEAEWAAGAFFRIKKGSGFCLIMGRWDSGDNSDPEYKRKDDYTIEVQCAEKKPR